jgi:hypothetical protein
MRRDPGEWDVDTDDDFSVLQRGLVLGRVLRQAIEGADGHCAHAVWTLHANLRIECDQCDGDVGRMRCDACVAPAEKCGVTRVPVARGASRSRGALVARQLCFGTEVRAARFLHEVSAHRRHVAQLRTCALFEGFDNRREPFSDLRVRCDIGHSCECADAQKSIPKFHRG